MDLSCGSVSSDELDRGAVSPPGTRGGGRMIRREQHPLPLQQHQPQQQQPAHNNRNLQQEVLSADGGKPLTPAQELRKATKPLMEKRRRARINQCLQELKDLILEALNKDPARHNKLEKADILEMAVCHLKRVHRQTRHAPTPPPEGTTKYRAGFTECANEVSRFVNNVQVLQPEVKQKLIGHLSTCINTLDTSNGGAVSPPLLGYPLAPSPPSQLDHHHHHQESGDPMAGMLDDRSSSPMSSPPPPEARCSLQQPLAAGRPLSYSPYPHSPLSPSLSHRSSPPLLGPLAPVGGLAAAEAAPRPPALASTTPPPTGASFPPTGASFPPTGASFPPTTAAAAVAQPLAGLLPVSASATVTTTTTVAGVPPAQPTPLAPAPGLGRGGLGEGGAPTSTTPTPLLSALTTPAQLVAFPGMLPPPPTTTPPTTTSGTTTGITTNDHNNNIIFLNHQHSQNNNGRGSSSSSNVNMNNIINMSNNNNIINMNKNNNIINLNNNNNNNNIINNMNNNNNIINLKNNSFSSSIINSSSSNNNSLVINYSNYNSHNSGGVAYRSGTGSNSSSPKRPLSLVEPMDDMSSTDDAAVIDEVPLDFSKKALMPTSTAASRCSISSSSNSSGTGPASNGTAVVIHNPRKKYLASVSSGASVSTEESGYGSTTPHGSVSSSHDLEPPQPAAAAAAAAPPLSLVHQLQPVDEPVNYSKNALRGVPAPRHSYVIASEAVSEDEDDMWRPF